MFFYGKYTSAYLLLNYGFCYKDNKYDQVDMSLEMRPQSNSPEHIICFDRERVEDIQEVHLKADKLNETLVYYLRLLIQTETLFQDENDNAADQQQNEESASTNTSHVSKELPVDDEALLNMNFTQVTDLAVERRVFDLYKRLLIYFLKKVEAKTNLEEDMILLASEELTDWQMRTAIVYRSERKKILHSQLHLINWLQHVLDTCDQSPSADELPHYFRFITFRKTEFEQKNLGEGKPESEKLQERNLENYFLRRIHAKNYLRQIYELVQTKGLTVESQ